MKLDLNEKEITGALQDSFREMNEVLGRKFAQAIDDPVWDWPGETQRHRGEVVGSPRNIVDRGELKSSYQPSSTPNTYKHAWNADHAMAVHSGAVYKDGSTMPRRPWTEMAMAENDTAEIFAKISRGKLEGVK